MKSRLSRRFIAIGRCILISSIAAVLLLPTQALAQSCGGQAGGEVLSTDPIFLGQEITIRGNIGASAIVGGDNISIAEWSYFPDCAGGQNYFTCTDQLNDVEFLEVLSTTCVDDVGNDVFWDTNDETIEVTFIAYEEATFITPSAASVAENTTCSVDFKVRVNSIDPDSYPKFIFGTPGFDTATCDTVPPTTGSGQGNVVTTLESCSIDLLKEVNVGGGWLDANDPDGPNLEVGGNAEYRLTVTNDGTAPFVNPPGVSIIDAALGISENIGPMTPGQVVILTSGDITELGGTSRCATAGSKENTSVATGVCSVAEDVSATANDNAWINCVPPPEIEILKEISIDGELGTYFDADTVGTAPTAEFPNDAWYSITVTNPSLTVDLVNVVINDPTLGIVNYPVGALAANTSVNFMATSIPELYFPNRCTTAGEFENIASTQGESALIAGSIAGPVFDPAWLVCVPPPEIEILKEISVDGEGGPYIDANDVGSAALAEFPSDAWYRITVTNPSLTVDLVNVVINDPTLGIVNFAVGALAANTSMSFLAAQIPELYFPGRCTTAGEFENIANTQGESTFGTIAGPVFDPAWLECVPPPEIEILKEISVDGEGGPYVDANDVGSAPLVIPPSDAWYRITVTNPSLTVNLINVVINDPTLGIVNYPVGALAANTSMSFLAAQIPELYFPDRCTVDGEFENIASTQGESAVFAGSIAGPVFDPAWLVCDTPGMAICRTPGFWGSRGGDDGDDDYKHGLNYTNIFLDGGVEICGSWIDNTDLADAGSAIEAICINKGDPMAKYIRMATSAALNCNLADCGEIETVLAECNADCVLGDVDAMNACAAELGCFNEGGIYEPSTGMCVFEGYCDFIEDPNDGSLPSMAVCAYDSDKDDADTLPGLGCELGEMCVRAETCHDRDLCPDDGDYCYEALGPASSPKKCSKARKNGDYIFDYNDWPVPNPNP